MLYPLESSLSWTSSSPEETHAIGQEIASYVHPGMILCLEGELGTGKTTLLKGLISSLTSLDKEEIQSPTFILLNLYPSAEYTVCHFDLYRLKSPEEFQERGFLDYFDKEHLCLIEWSSKVAHLIPPQALYLSLTYQGAELRNIVLSRAS